MSRTASNVLPRVDSRTAIGERELKLAGLVWRNTSVSRWELHQLTGLHPNLVGKSIQKLIDACLLREGSAASSVSTAGRPRVPLEIEDQRSKVLGLSISPGEVRVQALTLRGRPLAAPKSLQSSRGDRLIELAKTLLIESLDPDVQAVGVSMTGLLDIASHTLLFSSAAPSHSAISLQPLFDAAGATTLILDNDMHALSAQWLLGQREAVEDTLLVSLDDGRIGASMLIGGKHNRGCVTAGNELGHHRLTVETDRCYCGHVGCLERVFSTSQLRRLGGSLTLADAVERPVDSDPLAEIIDHLTTGLANAVNFMRPGRLIVASPYVRHHPFINLVEQSTRAKLLPGLIERVRIEKWEHSCVQSAESAAWLALARLFGNTWT